MSRSSRCADCGATVVVTSASAQFRGGSIVLVCRPCAGEPAVAPAPEPEPAGDDYDEVVVTIEADYDDLSPDALDDALDRERAAISGAVDVDERHGKTARRRDPTLPAVVVDKAR